jgi:broad specificity phosphatase PhoE
MKIFLVIAMLVLVLQSCSSTIYVVRHAEKQAADGNAMMNNNPDLSADGQKRAEALATFLAGKKITAVYATPYKRTQQTAAPTASLKALPVKIYNPNQGNQLIDSLAHLKRKGYLVVGHSNTVPAMLRHIGLNPGMQDIPESDFDNLFTVRIRWFFGRKMRLEQGTYGAVSP